MSENIGSKIEQLRKAAELQQSDLATAAGIDETQVRMIESGEASPSISTLIKIARRLGVRLGTLLDGAEMTSPTVSKPHSFIPTINTSRPGGRIHLDFFSLASQKSDRNMEPFYVMVEHAEQSRDNYSTHEGEEFIYVLEGSLVIFYGTEEYRLDAGDTIYYDSIVPHLVTTPGEGQKARILAVTYTPY